MKYCLRTEETARVADPKPFRKHLQCIKWWKKVILSIDKHNSHLITALRIEFPKRYDFTIVKQKADDVG